MSKNNQAVCRNCRREGEKLFLKGERCTSNKCAMEEGRNPVPPGGMKYGRRTTSDYNVQLREKQKVKKSYGMRERQFRNYYKHASSMKGVSGDNLIELLERRLDNVIFRLGFADSRKAARQLVKHGHFTLNERRADIPSMQVRDGDVIRLKSSKQKKSVHKPIMEKSENDLTFPWLDVDYKKMTGKFTRFPSKQEFDPRFQMNLIIEFYSR